MNWTKRKDPNEYYTNHGSLYLRAKDTINIFRQNHALEHATIAVLLERLDKRVRMVGHAGINGFYIYGDIDTGELEEAVREGLYRLQGGEKNLAVSPMCGTNLVVTGLVAGIASMVAGKGHTGMDKFSRLVQASIIAIVVAQPLGRLAQKHITTTSEIDNVRIGRVIKLGKAGFTRHKVELLRL